jgi:tetratricopeptide (TPR) repeat protein
MENKNYLYNNYLNMARNLRTDNNLLKAMSFYKKAYALDIGKHDIELLMDMALLYDELGLSTEAENKYFEIIKLDEDEARAYYGLAIIYDDKDELEKAKEYYEKAIEKNPNYLSFVQMKL